MLVLRRLCLAAAAAAFLLPAATANAATTAANVFVVPSGGTASCARVASPVDFASAPASAKCSTIQAAAAALSGGDTGIVKSGTYPNASISGVTKSPAVTLKVEAGGTANVGGTTWVGSSGITLDGTEGANGQGFSTSSGFTVGSNGGAALKNFKITGALIHDAGGGAVVYMTGCDNVTMQHLEIKNITGADGIQMANFTGQPMCTNVTFDDIYMHDFNATCGVDHQDGVQIRSGTNVTFTNSKIVKLNNCGSQGFFANQEGDLGGSNTTLSNTVIAGINGNAINFSSKAPQRMINNTIDGGLNTCQPVTSTCNGVIMKNNVLNTSCGGLALYHNRVQNSGDWANNVTSSNCGYSSQGDTVAPSFTAMFTAPGSPSYDYHLKAGAFAIGKANTLDYTPTDFDRGARDLSPDAGADEYGNTPGTPPTTPPPPADTTAPTTTMTSATSGSTTSTNASFAFTGTDDTSAVTFECKLDSGAWAACTSPKAYTSVAVGSHTFSVRAKDAAGNVDASPATATWTVTSGGTTPPPADTTAPTTTITSATSGSTTSTNASFAFTGADNASAVTFECKLDTGAWAACTSPKAYTSVAVGSHTFSVRAKDAAGNVDASPATATWTVTSGGTTPPPTPAAGLVAAYGFNETTGTTVADRSGNGLTGTITGAQHSNGGKFGGALTFNGTSDLVTVPDNAKLHLTKGMTLEAWVAPSKLSGWNSVMLKEQTGDMTYALYANTDANRPAGYVFTTGEQDVRSTGAQLPVNAWSHVATTYDGTALRMYVNGTLVGTHTISGAIKTSTGALRIGGNKVWGEWFAGRIDEVRVYDHALSSTEIKTDMSKAV